MRQALAFMLCVTLAAPGCASGYRFTVPRARAGQSADAQRVASRAAVAEFARQLPVGSRVRVRLAERRTVRGTLMNVTDRALVVQPRTRIMEPALEIPLDELTGIEVEQPSNVGRAIAIGVATGAGTALGVFLLILAIAIND